MTRFALPTRQFVPNRIEATKKAQGTARTDTFARSWAARGLPVTLDIANFTTTPASTIVAGMRMAHSTPRMDCLYLMRMSRQTIMYNRSRYRNTC